MIPRGLLALGFSFLAVASARAEDSPFPEWLSGKAIWNHFESTLNAGRPDGAEGTLQEGLTIYTLAEPKFSEKVSGRAELRGSVFRKSLEHPDVWSLRGDVKEASVSYRDSGWDLKAGQILTAWGRSDFVNPTNFLGARDYTFLSTGEELRRLGAPGARVSFVPNGGASPLEFTAAWNARYPQSKMLIPTFAIPQGLSVQTEPQTPTFLDGNQEVAVKLAYLASSWDASISVFDGHSHFGQFVWNGRSVELDYLPVRAVGGDFSVAFEHFVLRGESAYYFYDAGSAGLGNLALTEPNHWETVLGVEKPIGDRFRVLVQLLYRLHPNLPDSQTYVGSNLAETALVRGIGTANALIQNYKNRSKLGATFLLNYDSEDTNWHAEIEGVGNFVAGDYYIRPLVSRKFFESLRVGAGLDYYGGPIDEPLGALRGYRSAFLEGTYSF